LNVKLVRYCLIKIVRSNNFKTIKDNHQSNFFLKANKEEINDIVNKLELLLSEILNNKPLRTIDSTCTLALIWNQLLEKKFNSDSIVTWFDTEWLFTENYLYIRIKEIFEKT